MGYKFSVFLICTGNSIRSQMAEGFVRYYLGDKVDVESAGTMPSHVHTYAIAVMKEVGIDISKQRSKSVDDFAGREFDLVITLCSHAKESCGIFPWVKEQVHMGFHDPIGALGTPDEILRAFRDTRDEIRKKLLPFIEERYDGWRWNKDKEI
jgi:arsenate reductase